MSRFYCHDVTCRGAGGFDGAWVPDSPPSYSSGGEPGYWLDEQCPFCGGDLFDERLEWENPMEALADELEQTGALDLEADERRDVDWMSVYSVVQKELSRQAYQRRKADAEAKARHQEYLRAVEAGEREPYPDLPF